MRSLITSIVLLLTFGYAANSQSFFIKLFSDSSNVGISDLLATADSNLLLVGSTIESGGGLNLGCSLTCVDTLGNLIFTKRYFRSGLIQSLTVQVANEGYLLSGVDEVIHGLLLKADSFANQDFVVSYGDSANWTVSTSASVLPSGNILSFGFNRDFTDNNNFDIVVVKHTQTGNFLEGKKLDIDYHDLIAKDMMLDPNEFVVCGQTSPIPEMNNQVFLMRIDSNVNVLSCKRYSSSLTDLSVTDYLRTKDGSNYLLLSGFDTSSDERFTGLLKADSEGDPLWLYRFYADEAFQGKHLENCNGGLLLSGNLSMDTNFTTVNHGVILNLDYSGNLIWSKRVVLNGDNTIGGTTVIGQSLFIAGTSSLQPLQRADYFLSKSIFASELGCEEEMYNGFTMQQYDVTNTEVQVLTTDFGKTENTTWQQRSTGNWSNYCSSNAVFDPGAKDEIIIFPNPCSDFIHITGGGNDLLIDCLDCLGRIVIPVSHKRQIDVSRLPEGLYLLRMNDIQTKKSAIYKFVKGN